TRSIPPAIRRALHTRDGGCRFPGCTHQRYVDAHHIEHWADGGETKLSNLVTLCRLHHRVVHEGKILIDTPPGGGWRFLHPDGRHFEVIRCTHTPSYAADELELTHAALGIHIDSDTAATRWRGERMDYDLGVWVLCNQAKRARAQAHLACDEHDLCEEQDQAHLDWEEPLDWEEQHVSAETFDEQHDVSAETSEA
ncbi:MAG TPA: HNH endonuclease, partial [Steroidobacteraceae bacterium]